MIRTWLASLVGFLGSGLALTTTATLQDFAYGLRVEAAGTGPVWELTLPEAVYRGVTRADLGDLRASLPIGIAASGLFSGYGTGTLMIPLLVTTMTRFYCFLLFGTIAVIAFFVWIIFARDSPPTSPEE